ncbi:XrtA system polysaccharide deacetylase [Psychrobium sp. 1_MG-2023]|uniref:XrtA system polysaccharide deacetylase n=1 Tax=Psychrobium sp. 1_MG-2023 TaxID=3062624 RepID=UPI000C335A78|nr:XrtA system polysaccharide deacetylase [Psychrobium sp. 1_MG-2023]MDP2561125.1 DUF3473 domain-containing protein [Psychrobium sp. 1_MG-2023]PKF55101.1 polysaccharide deacetylase family protein [Alteromonadales bacterium alter-6D02]
MSKAITNAMTVDVEDYFQVSAFAKHYPHSRWDSQPLRVEKNTQRLLSLFNKHQIKATFFTLSWVAERCPNLIKEIVAQGHELASHGHWHQRVSELSPQEFKQDLYRSKSILEQVSGVEVMGYRAPSFSIGDENFWAFEIIRELGFRYSSSTYPIKHDHYGVPQWPRFSYQVIDELIEIPVTTLKRYCKTWPIAGGGYFRLAPYQLSRWALKQFHLQEQRAAVFYVHPWELDPQQPRTCGVGYKTRFRHYLNLDKVEQRLGCLLTDFNWSTMKNVYQTDLQLIK